MSRAIRHRGRHAEPLERRLLLATFTVTNTNTTGLGSLYQAIVDANATPAADVIGFDIATGSGVIKTISPTPSTLLPDITAPLTIDGTTQPGYAGSPVIELTGARVLSGNSRTGLRIRLQAPESVVRGMVINNWQGIGIQIEAPRCVVERNYIGTDATGANGLGNGHGFSITGVFGVTECRIASNVISGNGSSGVYMVGPAATRNRFVGNLVGVNAAGTAAVPNGHGFFIAEGPFENFIGGANPGEHNVISGNRLDGIYLGGTRNLVSNNFIGAAPNGSLAPLSVPNFGDGIRIPTFSGNGNIVIDNVIAFNSGAGVYVDGGQRNNVSTNRIYSNGGLGIDLAPAGVTPNDPGDGDAGSNGLQNTPVLTSAVWAADQTTVTGTLDSLPNTQFSIEFYASTPGTAEVDPTGAGEGARPLRSTGVITDASGHATFSLTLQGLFAGDVVTATTGRPTSTGDVETSEFSRGVTVGSVSGPVVRRVFVRSTGWSGTFGGYMRSSGLGTSAHGYGVPAGAEQLRPLPWPGINRVSVEFSEPVTVRPEHLTVRGVRRSEYAVTSVSYDAPTRTATWALAELIDHDKVVIRLDGDGADGIAAGGKLLDGEWVNGADAYPSGDSTPGGDFVFRINVLPGDVSRSSVVLADDFSQVKRKFFSSTSGPGTGDAAYSIFHDVNGSGSILADDFSEVKRRFFSTLPSGEPGAGGAAPPGVSKVRRDVLA